MDENESLLPSVRPVIQGEETPIRMNIISGSAILAQIGIWLLLITVWYLALSTDINLATYHPLFNTVASALLINGILLLQPTQSAQQKKDGTISHSILMTTALLSFAIGAGIIWWNKHVHDAEHYTSTHGKLGLITAILLLTQVIVGATQYYLPSIYGGVDNAKKLYKYHRVFGYLLTGLVLVTATYGTQTPWFRGKYDGLALYVIFDVLIVLGVIARVRTSKMRIL